MNILLSLSTAWQGNPPTNLIMLSNSSRCFLSLFLGKGKQTLGEPLPLPRIMFLFRCQLTPSHSKVVSIIVGILPRTPGQRKDLRKLPALFVHLLRRISCPLGSSSPPKLNRVTGVITWIAVCQMKCHGKSLRGVGILSIYNQAKAAIDTFIWEHEQHAFLKTWVS